MPHMSDNLPTNPRRSLKWLEFAAWLTSGFAAIFACWFYSPNVPAGEGRFYSNWFLDSGLYYLALVFPGAAVGAAIGAVRGYRLNDAVTGFLIWLVAIFLWVFVGTQVLGLY